MGLYITYLNMSNYTDKRTGIVYTNIGIRSAYGSAYGRSAYGSAYGRSAYSSNAVPQPHLDAFIPPAFLKTYF
jgi:hypothetical protein